MRSRFLSHIVPPPRRISRSLADFPSFVNLKCAQYTKGMNDIFGEIGLVIIVATSFALLARVVKQPPLVGYIIAGLALGPVGAHLLNNPDLFDALRQIGIALLLFLVGLELDWKKAKAQLRTAFALGLMQVAGSFVTGMILALIAHQSIVTGIYIGAALAFASTVIVVKIFSESRDLNALHGRLSVGILLFQDILAIIGLTFLSGFSQTSNLTVGSMFFLLSLKIAAILVLTWFMAENFLPPLFNKIAHNSELLFLVSLAWCFTFTLIMSVYGLPIELGALLAGLTLATLPYNLDIVNRLRSLRDFFVILLFVALGSSVVNLDTSYLILTIGLVALTIFGKPIITFFALTARGYTSRTSFITSLTQGQLSEFSLILVGVGLANHQINEQLASSITVTAIVSLFISSLLLTNHNWLYNGLRTFLQRFERTERFDPSLRELREKKKSGHIIIFGYHRMGYHILKKLCDLHHEVVVVDFNPDIVRKLQAEGVDCQYGDVEDDELLEALDAKDADMIISTIPHHEETMFLIEWLKSHHSDALAIVTAHQIDDALDYYHLGASYVILPHLLGGEHVADLIAQHEKHQLGELMHHRAEEIKLLRAKNHALYYD